MESVDYLNSCSPVRWETRWAKFNHFKPVSYESVVSHRPKRPSMVRSYHDFYVALSRTIIFIGIRHKSSVSILGYTFYIFIIGIYNTEIRSRQNTTHMRLFWSIRKYYLFKNRFVLIFMMLYGSASRKFYFLILLIV